jgi:hypothetical protein
MRAAETPVIISETIAQHFQIAMPLGDPAPSGRRIETARCLPHLPMLAFVPDTLLPVSAELIILRLSRL